MFLLNSRVSLIRASSLLFLLVAVISSSGCGNAQLGQSRINMPEGFVEVGYVGEKPVYFIYGTRPSDSYETKHSMRVGGKMTGKSTLWMKPPGTDISLDIEKLVVMSVTDEKSYNFVEETEFDADEVGKLAYEIMAKYESATPEELEALGAKAAKLLKGK